MSHALMNLMAVWMISAGNHAAMDGFAEPPVPAASGYIVVDRMDETFIIVETQSGMVELPRDLFPGDEIHEGAIIEWRVNEDEEAWRLQEAQARIERLQNTAIVKDGD